MYRGIILRKVCVCVTVRREESINLRVGELCIRPLRVLAINPGTQRIVPRSIILICRDDCVMCVYISYNKFDNNTQL